MFSFFKNKKAAIKDYSFLQADMHSHLIPGIDDGAKTPEDAVELVSGLVAMGYSQLFTTPHIMAEYYPNTPDIILDGLEELRARLKKSSVEVSVSAAAEYYIDDYFESLLQSDAPLLTLPGNRVLIEFSTFAEPARAPELIFQLNARGYRPVLAHPERYLYYGNRFEKFEEFRKLGCGMQVNLLSLTGHYGSASKKLAIKLLKAGYIDFLGTDLHHHRHLRELRAALQNRSVLRLLNKWKFRNPELSSS